MNQGNDSQALEGMPSGTVFGAAWSSAQYPADTINYNSMQDKLLLDMLKMDHIIANCNLLSNMEESEEPMMLLTNTGSIKVTHHGTLMGAGSAWYDQSAIGNILSYSKLVQAYQITVDMRNKNSNLSATLHSGRAMACIGAASITGS